MDIKELNKSQLIMLAIFLSFITSIATGITTVTLMQQAPPSVTAPINRVVQQTVDKIEQVEGKTVTQTVIVKEEDLVVDAISKNQSAVFTLSKQGYDLNDAPIQIPIGRAFAVSTDNVVATDANLIPGEGAYFLKNNSGTFKASILSANKGAVTFLKIGDAVDGLSKLKYTVPTFGDVTQMKTGQEIIVLGNTISTSIFEGNTNISLNVGKDDAGSLVVNLDGDALGMAVSGDTASFVPMSAIVEALKTADPTASVTPVSPAPGTPATP